MVLKRSNNDVMKSKYFNHFGDSDGWCIIFKFSLISTFYVTNAENRLKSFKHCGLAVD